jgi:hypothetical protein
LDALGRGSACRRGRNQHREPAAQGSISAGKPLDAGRGLVVSGLDAASPSLSRRIRIWALIVLSIASFVTIVPLFALPLDLAFLRLDMLMLLIGFGCLFFAYVGTRA